MNISKENIDSLNAVLKIELSAADYQERVETVLADYRKTADMPGFRKGKVPAGVVKKRYGIPVKVEEINKILSDSVTKYIVDEKLDILGNPLPKESEQIDWERQEEFVFEYELGLAPTFEVNISKKNKLDLYKIKADKAMIDRYAEDIAKRYGKMSSPEKVEEKDLVYGTFQELDAEGSAVEGGITNQASVSLDAVKTKKLKNEFIGSEKGAVIVLDPKKSFENDTDAAAMLNIDKEAYAGLKAKFSFTIDNISRMEPAELNTELYDKIYGEGVVKNEKEFREKITAESENMFVGEADRKFQNDAVDYLLEKTSFDLPEEFLKRWMQTVSEKPVTLDEIEKDFEGYKKSLKWQIIENKIAKENEISVSREEAVAETKKLITAQMAQYGQLSPEEEQLEQYAQQVLANKEEEKNIYDRLFSSKMTAFFKSSFKVNEKEISYEKFVKLVQA
ncbi:MAG: trigger factor [Flavobacteriales bacterium]|nr:trigger factor [Flavobacteriales bacterium]